MSGDASSSGQLHEARHYQFSRRMITPTFPTEGDHLKIETEEAIFGLTFADGVLAPEVPEDCCSTGGR